MQQMISDNKKNLSSSSVSDNIEQQGGEEEKKERLAKRRTRRKRTRRINWEFLYLAVGFNALLLFPVVGPTSVSFTSALAKISVQQPRPIDSVASH